MDSNLPITCHDILERIGVTKTQTQKRIDVYKIASINATAFFRKVIQENIDVLVAGSRGEGTAFSVLDSDIDVLFIQRSVRCFKSSPSANESKNYLVSCLLDFENVKNGYALLRVMSVGHTGTEVRFLRNINDGILLHNGHRYLRNDIIFTNCFDNQGQGVSKKPFVFDDITGPAKQLVFGEPYANLSIDLVQAFPVSYPAILDRLRKRESHYAWPSNDVIERAVNQSVFVVPVGVPGSEEEILQWRLSVTLTEQTLTQSFNDTQIKLFVAVKMIVKNVLKPVCDHMSSYLVKNIMFWVSEETKECLFRREYFEELLLKILKRLKRSIYWKYLPNYMFPSINMLDNKIFETERRKLVERLDDIIANGCLPALLQYPLVKDIIQMPRKVIQDKLIFRQLAEIIGVAIFSIPNLDFETLIEEGIIHKEMFNRDIEEFIRIFFRHVLPIIRATNPFNFFDILITMTDEELLYRVLEASGKNIADVTLSA